MNVLVFDIETIPDTEAGRRLYELEGLDDNDVAKAMFHLRQQKVGHEFLPHHLHRIAAISVVYRGGEEGFKVWSLGDEDSDEKELLTRFFHGIDHYTPTIVSWNGSGFDLPVIHYRALRHAISAPRYWDMGDDNRDFRFNNYISRYHLRHTDLMDLLSLYNLRSAAPLDEIATMLGFPGKMGMDGSKVWDAWQDGDIKGIRNYCETDVLNTYLVYLRFQLMRGYLTEATHETECQRVYDKLMHSDEGHLQAFAQAWRGSVKEDS